MGFFQGQCDHLAREGAGVGFHYFLNFGDTFVGGHGVQGNDRDQLYNSLHCFVTKLFYLQIMSKITIDLKKWATAKQLAKENGWDNKINYTQRVTTMVLRYGIKTWTIEQLGIRLIDRDQFNKYIKDKLVS